MSRLSINSKKSIILVLLMLGMIAVVGSFIYIAFKDTTVSQTVGKENANIRYVLVNEDQGTDFEQTHYQLGNDFVTLISQDEENQWETVSRSIATTGIENGQYDAMIVIPQNFSETVLSLQSTNPEKANVEYLVRDGQSQVTNQIIEKKVNEVLYDFNKRVVQMYFSSIVGSLSEAQQNVTDMVDTEAERNDYLVSRVQTPFQNLPQSFDSALSAASILKSSSDAVEAEQEGFVRSVKSLMDGNAEELGSIADSFSPSETSGSTSDITFGTSALTPNGNGSSSLDDFNQQFANQFAVLKASAPTITPNNPLGTTPVIPSLYDRFLADAQAYEASQTQAKTTLETNIKAVEEQLTSLQSLRQTIATNYYGDGTLTPETATIDNAKEAIARLMNPNDGSNLNGAYLETLNRNVGSTPVANLGALIDALSSNGAITAEQAGKYRNELAIVNRYAKDFKVPTGTTTAYDFLSSNSGATTNVVTTTSTFNISTTGDTISLSGNGVSVTNGPSIATQMQTSLNEQLGAYNKIATVTYGGNAFVVSIATVATAPTQSTSPTSGDVANNGTQASTDDKGNQDEETTQSTPVPQNQTPQNQAPVSAVPASLPVTVSVDLSWTLAQPGEQSYQETTYQWSNSKGSILSGKLASFDETNDQLIQDLPRILTNFAALEQSAQQITTIFSEPSDTVSTFASRLSTDDRSLASLASKNSVYYLYNNMELKQQAKGISDDFGKSYKSNGDNLYKEVDGQIIKLKETLGDSNSPANDGTLYGQLNAVPNPSDYYQLVLELGEWYQSTQSLLDNFYTSETQSRADADSATAQQLASIATQLRSMQESVREMASNTESTANNLQNTADVVADFTARTTEIQSSTNTLLEDINQSVANSNTDLSENQDYAAAFNRVLSNTKNGGADNARVFNFLSSPIEVSSIQGSMAKTSVTPYYMTIVGALIIGIVSFFTVNLMKDRPITTGDGLMTPTRVWTNLPNLVKILGIALVTALVYASATTSLTQQIPKLLWFVYSFLFIFSLIMVFVYIIRDLKRTVAVYIFISLVGVYLLLMPIIGATTKPGSLLSTVYRLSPLQNIENGYTAMINGINVSAGSLIVLAGLSIFAVCMNLFVKPGTKQQSDESV